MSPLPEGYYPTADESVPTFGMTTGYSNYIFGMLWGIVWSIFVDIENFILLWFVVTFLTGMLFFGFWLIILYRRFHNPLQNLEIEGILNKAKLKLEYSGEIKIWFRDSPKLICMIASTPLYTAILISQSALHDILNHPEDGEVILAQKIASLRPINPVLLFLGAGSSFLCGVFFHGAFLFSGAIFSLFTSGLTILIGGSLLIVVILLCIAPLSLSTRGRDTHEYIEELYRIPPYVASMRVFGGEEVPDSKIDDWFSGDKERLHEETDTEKQSLKSKSLYTFFIVTAISTVILILLAPVRDIVIILLIIAFSLTMGVLFGFLVHAIGSFRHLFGSGKGDDDSGKEDMLYHDNTTSTIESLLRTHEDYSNHRVRFAKESKRTALVVFDTELMRPSNVACYLSPKLVELIPEPESLVPYIIYDIRASRNASHQSRYGCVPMMPGFILFFIAIFGLFNPSLVIFSNPFLNLGIFAAIMIIGLIVSGLGMHLWSKKNLFDLDVELALKYSGHLEMLQKMVESGYATQLGRISLQQRIDYLRNQPDIV